MASVSYGREYCLYHQLFHPQTIPETHDPPPRSVQIEITIGVSLIIIHHNSLTHRFSQSNPNFSEETLRFDLHLLEDYVQAYEILGAMLTRFQISPATFTFDDIVNDIIRYGLTIRNWASNRGRMVLPVQVEIWGTVVEHVEQVNSDRVLIRRAMEESALATNHGMVPAEESSVKKMLKKVKVKGEDCVICLEEINGGSDASQMPCSHTFHGSCIEEWLKQSHYCPICRFEMPTISES